jgi:uncharacterized protein involved in type VI secretion and phage assembly
MEEHDAMYEMAELMEGCFYGKYRGLVTDNQDPMGRGRLKVLVPAVMDDVDIWAMPCVPYAGKNMGLYAIPEKDTGVWVEFEAGDPNYPIWVGCYWADDQLPENEHGTEAGPPLKILRSQQGLMITLDDDEQVITMSDKSGDNLITIQVKQRQVTVKGAGKVVVEAPKIDLTESASQPVVLGNKLLQYLNQLVALYQTHTHNSPAPTPVPPLPPPPTDLISQRVSTG